MSTIGSLSNTFNHILLRIFSTFLLGNNFPALLFFAFSVFLKYFFFFLNPLKASDDKLRRNGSSDHTVPHAETGLCCLVYYFYGFLLCCYLAWIESFKWTQWDIHAWGEPGRQGMATSQHACRQFSGWPDVFLMLLSLQIFALYFSSIMS